MAISGDEGLSGWEAASCRRTYSRSANAKGWMVVQDTRGEGQAVGPVGCWNEDAREDVVTADERSYSRWWGR
jgi:hypothetical protein